MLERRLHLEVGGRTALSSGLGAGVLNLQATARV